MTEKIIINSKKLKAFRIVELEMNQEQLGEIMGMAKSTYCAKEQDPEKFTLIEIVRLLNYAREKTGLKYQVEDIFFS